MIQNKYFLILLPESALDAIFQHCIEKNLEMCRRNNDKTKTVVKLLVGANIPAVLQGKTVYNHTEILQELSKPEWVKEM